MSFEHLLWVEKVTLPFFTNGRIWTKSNLDSASCFVRNMTNVPFDIRVNTAELHHTLQHYFIVLMDIYMIWVWLNSYPFFYGQLGLPLKSKPRNTGDEVSSCRYLSPCLIIMKVHQATWCLLNLPGVHKSSGELDSILDVSRAPSPLPAFLLIVISLLFPVAAALAQVALAAGCSNGMGHSCCCDGVGECCFPTAWKKITCFFRDVEIQ